MSHIYDTSVTDNKQQEYDKTDNLHRQSVPLNIINNENFLGFYSASEKGGYLLLGRDIHISDFSGVVSVVEPNVV